MYTFGYWRLRLHLYYLVCSELSLWDRACTSLRGFNIVCEAPGCRGQRHRIGKWAGTVSQYIYVYVWIACACAHPIPLPLSLKCMQNAVQPARSHSSSTWGLRGFRDRTLS